MTALTSNTNRSNPFNTIVLAGLIAGTLDITAACLQYYIKTGKGPGNVLRFVASGVFGTDAFKGGNEAAAWGLVFHYIVAFLFTLFFFWIYPRMKFLSWNKVITGAGYGIFAWLVMNLLVVPLSNAPAIPFVLSKAIVAAAILMVCIGLPISLIVSRYYESPGANR